MWLQKLLSRFNIEIVKSDRPWREMIPISGLLRSRNKNICYLCNSTFADINALANHYRQHHPKGGA